MPCCLTVAMKKSRLCRARAEIALGGLPRLVQAQVDLQEIINEDGSSTNGVQQAKILLEQVEDLLKVERGAFPKQGNKADWSAHIRLLKSSCW